MRVQSLRLRRPIDDSTQLGFIQSVGANDLWFPTESRRSAWKKTLLFSSAFLIPLGLWLTWDYVVRQNLERARNQFELAGYPMHVREQPEGVDGGADDDASRIREIIAGFPTYGHGALEITKTVSDAQRWTRRPGDQLTLPGKELLRIRAGLHTPAANYAVAQLHLTSREEFHDPGPTPNGERSLYLYLHRLIDLLVVRPQFRDVHRGLDLEAAHELGTAMRLAAWCVQDPSEPPAHLWTRHMEEIRETILLLARAGISPDAAAESIGELRRAAENHSTVLRTEIEMKRLLHLEHGYQNFVAKEPWAEQFVRLGSERELPSWLDGPLSTLLRPHFGTGLRRCYDWMFAAEVLAQSDDGGTVAEWKRLRARVPSLEPSVEYIVLSSVVSDLYDLVEENAKLRMTALALSLIQHREETGSWPETLSDLSTPSAFELDPCSGTAFKFTIEPGVIELRANGLDGDDDGGRTGPEDFEDIADIASSTGGPAYFDLTRDRDLVVRLTWPASDQR